MKKLAIIGASYLQEPLIQKAKAMGIETHVFAWKANDVGERSADFFYPISIVEKEEILSKCRDIGIDGICTIASDLAAVTVNYVAEKMHLFGNSFETTMRSTNKHLMRQCFEEHGDPSPKSILVEDVEDLNGVQLKYPVIVKPIDRSGSRGITKVKRFEEIAEAIENAKNQGFEKKVLVEEYATGQEYSVEFITWKGQHTFLAMTKKFTTGSPHFIETAHIEPAPVEERILERVKSIVSQALDNLGITYGASHSEIKISKDGDIKIIEIGGRMGGDNIGSDLVWISTGIDFIKAVIAVSLGIEPDLKVETKPQTAGIRFVFSQEDVNVLNKLKQEHPEFIVREDVQPVTEDVVTDSSSRFGYFLMKANSLEDLIPYMPKESGIE